MSDERRWVANFPDLCPWGSYGETHPHTEHEQGIWTRTDYAALVRGLGVETENA